MISSPTTTTLFTFQVHLLFLLSYTILSRWFIIQMEAKETETFRGNMKKVQVTPEDAMDHSKWRWHCKCADTVTVQYNVRTEGGVRNYSPPLARERFANVCLINNITHSRVTRRLHPALIVEMKLLINVESFLPLLILKNGEKKSFM